MDFLLTIFFLLVRFRPKEGGGEIQTFDLTSRGFPTDCGIPWDLLTIKDLIINSSNNYLPEGV